MLQEVLEDDDFLYASSAKRSVNISGMVRAIELKISQLKDMSLPCLNERVYCSATTTMVAEIETK
jgi:hypothetical protein